jgi:hypothetical protein
MAKLVFGMNQSLDGYVDHMAFGPSPTLFRHFIEEAQGQAGSIYGRHMYEIMRYWDDAHPEWNADEQAFAGAWRKQPKWVVSRTLKSVGPNAYLHPVVLGRGKPYFAGPRPPLRLVTTDRIGEDVIRLTYVPAR